VVTGAATVILAAGAGKSAAEAIHRDLSSATEG
jgi:NADPH-dependent glutamate synthase beta subunit-like oxidoreductase